MKKESGLCSNTIKTPLIPKNRNMDLNVNQPFRKTDRQNWHFLNFLQKVNRMILYNSLLPIVVNRMILYNSLLPIVVNRMILFNPLLPIVVNRMLLSNPLLPIVVNRMLLFNSLLPIIVNRMV